MMLKARHAIIGTKDARDMRCPICDCSGSVMGCTVKFEKTPAVPVCRCDTCGYRWLLRDQSSTADVTYEMTSRNDSTSTNWVISRLPADIRDRQDARVLDIGCWNGEILRNFPANWSRMGIELNPYAAELARRGGANIIQKPVEVAILPEEHFDLIIMLDVLEHLSKPMEALHKVSHWLAPGGCLFAVTGNGAGLASRLFGNKWYYLNYPEHIGCFTPESIRYALNSVHLDVESIAAEAHQTATFGMTLRKVSARMSGNTHTSDDGLGHPALGIKALILAISRILRRRDHMVVIARKSEQQG